MADRVLTNIEKFILDEVGTRTTAAARMGKNFMLAADADGDDKTTLLSYFDVGMNKLLMYSGIVRADPVHGREVIEEGTTTSTEDDLLANQEEGGGNLLPQELWQALAYWVMHEWYANIDPNLSTFWLGKYKTEAAEHRFSGTKPYAMRQTRIV